MERIKILYRLHKIDVTFCVLCRLFLYGFSGRISISNKERHAKDGVMVNNMKKFGEWVEKYESENNGRVIFTVIDNANNVMGK